jgi:hypothetical protein
MSESLQLRSRRRDFRGRLLLTVSASVLLFSLGFAREAKADGDADRPNIWIDVGGAFDQMSRGETSWAPPNLTPPISNPPIEPFGRVPAVGYDFDARISFQPDASPWIYTASVRYGRAKLGPKTNHDQTYILKTALGAQKYVLTNYDFANATQKSQSTHTLVDFSAGKDVGLGVFGGGTSTFTFGVRVAQLNERSDAQLVAFVSAPAKYSAGEVAHKANALITRGFTGAGPSVSWDASAPLTGTLHQGISLDWGTNVAALFGRQKTRAQLHTKDTRYYQSSNGSIFIRHTAVLSQLDSTPIRNRTVLVPNVGGFAGFSYHLPNAKVSFGYRADFFFGAVDGGLATAYKDTRGYYGPFAMLSVGF